MADPDLHLLVDGRIVRPISASGSRAVFAVTAKPGEIRIVSRSVVPAALDPLAGDQRRLGVPLRALVLRGMRASVMVHADDAALTHGFHEAEAGHRWTDGAALLPRELFALLGAEFTVEIILAESSLDYQAPG